ncbi:MAG: hypothetical protein ACOH5I_14050 [Oligoflexus sp.]
MIFKRLVVFAAFIVSLLAGYLLLQLIANSIEVSQLSAKLRSQFSYFEPDLLATLSEKKAQVRERAALYDYLLRQDHLVDGMVVNRNMLGQVTSVCDSLLFSSLRFVGLKKLGHQEQANEAWRAIERSQRSGHWQRHPRCAAQSTSRDMIVGVLAALTQKPQNHRLHLSNLMSFVERNKGFISHGPFHVSLLTPGLAEIIRVMVKEEKLAAKGLPANIQYGFSTLEFDTIMSARGYTSHLNALVIWIELEMLRSYMTEDAKRSFRSLASLLHPLTDSLLSSSIKEQRLQWLTQRLARLDQENVFFRYLQLKAAGALTPKAELNILEQILTMKQFPPNRLPTTCERKADYLWQRDSIEYQARDYESCHEIFSGVDFIWMAALLQ